MKNLKKNQGITLIALVITIIVMLILVAVTITIAVNGGLFEYAGKAAKDTNTAIRKEQNLADLESGLDYEDLIDKYTTEDYPEDGWDMAWKCTGGTWSGTIEDTSEPLTGDVIAKAYKRGNVTIEGEEKTAYHLVIEGTGEIGAVVGQNINNVKVAQSSKCILDSVNSFYVAAKKPTVPDPTAWHAAGIRTQITKVIIREGTTEIGGGAFWDFTNLKTVTIPSSVTTIASGAFGLCRGLKSLKIPSSVTTIGAHAFESCTGLTNLIIPSGVTSIGEFAFIDVPHIQYSGTAEGAPWGALSMN